MKKKAWIIMMVLILTGIQFVSANGQGDAAGTDGAGAKVQFAENTNIDMLGWRYPITAYYAEDLESLSDIENLTVNTQLLDSGSAHEQTRLSLSGSTASPYEIIHCDDAFLNELATEGWLYPLDDLIEKYKDLYDLGDIADSMYKMGSLDGKTYGIPIVANSMNYFYNMDLFEKYGLEVPETYDDVIATAKKLKAEESIDLPFTINVHAGWAWRVEFHNFLSGYGGKWLNDDSTPAFNGPEGVKAVNKLLEVIEACMGEEGVTWSIDDSEIGMETGTLASCVTWTSRAANMDDPAKSMFVGKIGFAPAPSVVKGGPHAGPAAVDFFVIPANTEVDPEEIFKVIMEASDLESQIRAAEFGLTTRSAVASSGAGGRYVAAALATIANGAGNYGFNPAGKLARTAIENVLPTIMTSGKSVQEVLDEAAAVYVDAAKKQGFLK